MLADEFNVAVCCVFVWKSSQRKLWSALECFGKVQFCRLLTDKRGKSRGYLTCHLLWLMVQFCGSEWTALNTDGLAEF